jgi:SAM-dependent methyltransferase
MDSTASELRDFYATPLGGVARRILAHKIRARWRRADAMTVIGLGYASPFLGSFQGEALRLGAFMPPHQGALVWPAAGPIRTVMADAEDLPLADNAVDRIVLVHCLEAAGSQPRALLREVWRVLAPEGRMILIVPNRRGVWARRDATPFGHGQPYSRGQIERLLQDAMFAPLDWGGALHLPPIDRQLLLRWATAFERIGSRLWPAFSGVLMIEARKEVSAPLAGEALAKVVRRPVTVTQPAAATRGGVTSSGG